MHTTYIVNILENWWKMVETVATGKWNKSGVNDLAGRLNKMPGRLFSLFMHDKG